MPKLQRKRQKSSLDWNCELQNGIEFLTKDHTGGGGKVTLLSEVVREIVHDWDPVDLMFFCPPDEYDTEINRIVDAVNRTKSAVELAHSLQQIFKDQFHEQFTKHYVECLLVAKKILWKSGEKQNFNVVSKAKITFFPDKIKNRETITGFTTPAHFEGEENDWSMIVVFKEPVNEYLTSLVECTFLMENAPAHLLFPGNKFQLIRSGPFCEAEIIESDVPIREISSHASTLSQGEWVLDTTEEVARMRTKIIKITGITCGTMFFVIISIVLVVIWIINSFFKSLCDMTHC